MNSNKHTISVLVENEFGVLARVASMFAARGYNIDSLSVAPTLDAKYSHMTIVTQGNENIIEQIIKQLYRLIDTIEVKDLTGENFISRETILVKVNKTPDLEKIIEKLHTDFLNRIIENNSNSLVIELTGDQNQIDTFLEKIKPYGIIELIRTGSIAIERGKHG